MSASNKIILITNAYPSEEHLYRNGFIHRRVKAYERHGIYLQVFVMHEDKEVDFSTYQFEKVTVMKGNRGHLMTLLKKQQPTKILIHFVSIHMIDAIKKSSPSVPLIIWIHGFEAEAWHRRYFNFLESKEQLQQILQKKKTYYDQQRQLMNWLFQTDELNATFIHVSKWFKEHIVECDAQAKAKKAYIIPNPIDETLFTYDKKKPELRKKILLIRPFASRKYANDLAVEAIVSLSDKPFFKRLQFGIFGDGKLFNETIAPLKQFENVQIERAFLKQSEIAILHKQYGVFLCPTRWDSQGVSMCEAMASGLVPISTNISAIPEFITNRHNGLLANPEDPKHLAQHIEDLYFNDVLFSKLSSNAARDIINICGSHHIIRREMELITS